MNRQLPDNSDRNFTWKDLRQPHYLALIQALLDTGIDVRFRVTGKSMKPFLTGCETVTLWKESPTRLRIGDLIFFLNNQNTPILHRIVKIKSGNGRNSILYTKGDALSYSDEPITANNVLGKVTQVEWTKQNKTINILSQWWAPMNYIIARISRLQLHCNRMALMPGLHRRLAVPASRFIVFLAAR